jgi:hypothetical protein
VIARFTHDFTHDKCKTCVFGKPIILPILSTTKSAFLVEIQKAVLSLLNQTKRKKALPDCHKKQI